jgi:hypothetical protein
MKAHDALTRKGEDITVFPTDDVGVIFENVTSEGFTTVNKTETGPEPPQGFKVKEYYDIQTTASYQGKIKIRIIYDASNITRMQEETLQLTQWNERTEEWTNITTHHNPKYHLITGETSHLSIFGVTRHT